MIAYKANHQPVPPKAQATGQRPQIHTPNATARSPASKQTAGIHADKQNLHNSDHNKHASATSTAHFSCISIIQQRSTAQAERTSQQGFGGDLRTLLSPTPKY